MAVSRRDPDLSAQLSSQPCKPTLRWRHGGDKCCLWDSASEQLYCHPEVFELLTVLPASTVCSLTRCVAVVPAGGSLPVCAACKQRIYDEQYLQALNSDWHAICFRYGAQMKRSVLNSAYLLNSSVSTAGGPLALPEAFVPRRTSRFLFPSLCVRSCSVFRSLGVADTMM